ncbi:hypothetical protein A2W14_05700 [Candidatus Gottesmanbacteria bacterium RBG_16_37_8]|uniref:Orotidine 5'-phosphate decarboxylase domain-containing protein n=1 Tax=Candidatus Gottesmanbacteria bacterium RBG_16_37_8 TaxID=1798371 RepID=A0A1F5YVK0_9BACT|nr:MAG: hypothetical protein A2W14_05700 [Candidatus Gottesmanbacteria bacterium RBG_16_37_8]
MLDKKTRYLQVALNNTLDEAREIISLLPQSPRIIIEAGTPLIKRYGLEAIRQLNSFWSYQLSSHNLEPYIVADVKTMDRGQTEVLLAKDAGASAVVALGSAPIETINIFIKTCHENNLDSMVDMMNIDQPVKTLRNLRKLPDVVILHRGVDEEMFNKDKPIPYIQINKIRASYNTLIAMAGGDTIREVQRAIFNDANIVVVWKEFYKSTENTAKLAEEFLRAIK